MSDYVHNNVANFNFLHSQPLDTSYYSFFYVDNEGKIKKEKRYREYYLEDLATPNLLHFLHWGVICQRIQQSNNVGN